MACQLSALGRHRLDGGVLMFACGGGGPVSTMPCQWVPHLKVHRITSAVSPPACLPVAGHNTTTMPCLHSICVCEDHKSMVRRVKALQCCRCAKTLLASCYKQSYACTQDFCAGQDGQQAVVQYGVAAADMISAADAVIIDPVLCSTPMAGLYDIQALCRCSSKLTNICSGT